MAFLWVLLLFFGALVEGGRIPRQTFGFGPTQDHVGLVRVPLAHASQMTVAGCRLVSAAGHQVQGDINLRQTNPEDPVEITGTILGLAPGYHGFHVHQNANLTDNCKAAGPHFNPENHPHGAPQDRARHAGDLGNIFAEEDGLSTFHILDRRVSLYDNLPNQIVGRAIVVHEKEDDLGRGGNDESKKTGNAGARVACCIINHISPPYL